MTRTVTAVYKNGAFFPQDPCNLPNDQVVRLTVEPLDKVIVVDASRAQAIERFLTRALASEFCSKGPYPTRDSLHERR